MKNKRRVEKNLHLSFSYLKILKINDIIYIESEG